MALLDDESDELSVSELKGELAQTGPELFGFGDEVVEPCDRFELRGGALVF